MAESETLWRSTVDRLRHDVRHLEADIAVRMAELHRDRRWTMVTLSAITLMMGSMVGMTAAR